VAKDSSGGHHGNDFAAADIEDHADEGPDGGPAWGDGMEGSEGVSGGLSGEESDSYGGSDEEEEGPGRKKARRAGPPERKASGGARALPPPGYELPAGVAGVLDLGTSFSLHPLQSCIELELSGLLVVDILSTVKTCTDVGQNDLHTWNLVAMTGSSAGPNHKLRTKLDWGGGGGKVVGAVSGRCCTLRYACKIVLLCRELCCGCKQRPAWRSAVQAAGGGVPQLPGLLVYLLSF